MWVIEEKFVRVECLLEDLWMERGEMVKVRKIARVAGVIGSFTLAMGKGGKILYQGDVVSGG